jgi:uncharacterized protein YukE
MAQIKFDVAGMQHQSAQARGLASQLSSLRQEWTAATAHAASALGISELTTAFDSMRQAWAGQFEVCVDVVSALGDRLALAAADYNGAEVVNTDNARSVGP